METGFFNDEFFMREALKEAKNALEKNEVPIGAIVVIGNKIIGRGYNLTETLNDATAHAEMQAITSATGFLGGKYLTDATIYITLEPCVMCAGAIFWSKLHRIVYGASDFKQGYSKFNNYLEKQKLSFLHPKAIVSKGILENECAQLLSDFFRKKRKS